jgi:hypothetical protein
VAQLAGRVIDRYELELANHFEIEEQILFPAIENALGKLSLVADLIAQHRQVEDLIAQLRSAPTRRCWSGCAACSRSISGARRTTCSRWLKARLPEPVLRELGAAIERRVVRICL